MQITNVRNPHYLFADNDKISCEVQIGTSDAWQPYLAVANDSAAHGAGLHADLLAGKHGPVAPYSPPSAVVVAANVRAERARRIAATDWTQLADQSVATKQKYLAYRQALRDVTAQTGFPAQVDWPALPA
jgi:Phage tail assembly chaperone protein